MLSNGLLLLPFLPAITAVAIPPQGIHISELAAREGGELSLRDYTGSTYNELTASGSTCRDVTLIYARGTSQQGNVGDPAAVGPLFFNALASEIGAGSLAVEGVNYPASISGFLAGGDSAGSTLMASLVSTAATKCPNTKIVLSGYSQGGQLVHNAAAKLSATLTSKVTAVMVFGDPKYPSAFGSIPSSKTNVICHDGDLICEGTFFVTAAHTNYQMDAPRAAAWVAGLVA